MTKGDPLLEGVQRIGKDQLEWTANKLLKGAGAGADPTEIDVPGVTREVYVPVVRALFWEGSGFFYGARADAQTEESYYHIRMPWDFTTLVSAVIVGISHKTGTSRFVVWSQYGASGEASNTHSEGPSNPDRDLVDTQIFEWDISDILSNLAAGDYVGIKLDPSNTNQPNATLLGIKVRYT